MASVPVATAAARTPVLHDFDHAIEAAGLTSKLNSAKAITVFAPDNGAFGAIGQGNLTTLDASKSDLVKVVEFQIVSGRKTPADLASGRHLTSLRGTVIVPVKSRSGYVVNNANIICGNIRTANATVYIVNRILIPQP